MKALAFLLVCLPRAAWAQEASYNARLERLHNGQAAVEDALKHYSGALGLGEPHNAPQPAATEGRPSLFQIHGSLSTARLGPGRLLYGTLMTRLVVGPDGSPALIRLSGDQGMGSEVRVLGIARQAGTEGRVSIEISRVLFPAKTVEIHAQVLDAEGAFGLPAQVWSHKAWAVAGSMASSFISGLAAGQQTQSNSPLGFSQVEPTGRNSVLQGVAQTAADQSKRLIEEATADKPVLTIEAGAVVVVMIQEEVRW